MADLETILDILEAAIAAETLLELAVKGVRSFRGTPTRIKRTTVTVETEAGRDVDIDVRAIIHIEEAA